MWRTNYIKWLGLDKESDAKENQAKTCPISFLKTIFFNYIVGKSDFIVPISNFLTKYLAPVNF